MEKAKTKMSPDWTMLDLITVLKEIKAGKSRDSEGISKDIFYPSVVGENLKWSLLIMFNKLKQEGKIPSFMKKAIISPIPKKGSQFQLQNGRGIFIVNCVRGVIMKLIYNLKAKQRQPAIHRVVRTREEQELPPAGGRGGGGRGREWGEEERPG